jgi:hypothetical protein
MKLTIANNDLRGTTDGRSGLPNGGGAESMKLIIVPLISWTQLKTLVAFLLTSRLLSRFPFQRLEQNRTMQLSKRLFCRRGLGIKKPSFARRSLLNNESNHSETRQEGWQENSRR